MTEKKLPRGIRNNNPLNIRKNRTHWFGLRDFPTDTEFCEFTNMSWGFRAAFMVLRTYYMKYKLMTIRVIITRWSPKEENDTEDYIETVSKLSGIKPDRLLPPFTHRNMRTWVSVALVMAEVECSVKPEILRRSAEEGFELALKR